MWLVISSVEGVGYQKVMGGLQILSEHQGAQGPMCGEDFPIQCIIGTGTNRHIRNL